MTILTTEKFEFLINRVMVSRSNRSFKGSPRSRRKRGRGARTREKNGVLGAKDEGTPATKTPIFSSPPTPFQLIQLS